MKPRDQFLVMLDDHFGATVERSAAATPEGERFLVLTLERYPRGAIHVYHDHLVLVERGRRPPTDEVQVARHTMAIDSLLAALDPMGKLEWAMGTL